MLALPVHKIAKKRLGKRRSDTEGRDQDRGSGSCKSLMQYNQEWKQLGKIIAIEIIKHMG
jgi:hypothetical protein